MGNLQIKDLPEEVHEELRRRARLEGMTVRSYVQRMIEADQALPPRSEWFARVRAQRPVDPGVPIAELVAADRASRGG
ncbi:MAG: hypothetical protein ACR2G7_05095 [Acidimicrobiales bacterium]